jgi:hypothetical protein
MRDRHGSAAASAGTLRGAAERGAHGETDNSWIEVSV